MLLPRALPRLPALLFLAAVPLALAGCADAPTSPDIRPNALVIRDDPIGGGGGGGSTPPAPTAPTVSYVLTPADPDGNNAWYRSDVALEWTITYNTVDEPTLTGCEDQSIIADQAATYSCFATNSIGTSSTFSITIRRDATPPVVALTGPTQGATYVEGAVPGNACTTTDAMSGVATPASLGTSGGPLGSVTVTCSGATDAAGNAAPSVSVTYTVTAAPVSPTLVFAGFASPVINDGTNVARAGQTIPLKWRLLDASGAPVTDLASVAVKVTSLACAAEETADLTTEVAAGGSGLQNLGDGYYQFNWKTPKTYANSCKTMRLDLGVDLGQAPEPAAQFRFTR